MESQAHQLHFILFPLMSPGHMLPMTDLATTLTQQKQNIIVTIVTTPHNTSRFSQTLSQNSQIHLLQLQFPSKDAGFPEGCENFDMLPSMSMAHTFFKVANTLLQEQAEEAFEKLTPKPCCIISDVGFPYTSHIATKFNIPRISFYGVSCFCLVWQQKLILSNVMEKIATDSEYFLIPEIPHKIMITKAQTPSSNDGDWKDFIDKMAAAEMVSYGVVVNSFEELEPEYASDFKKTRNGKVWCVGPVSLRNKNNNLDMAQRGNNKLDSSIDVENCLKWLDLQKTNSVIYVCLGSICNLTSLQFIELGMALEACERPFIWVIRERNQTEELNKWIKESCFEEIRTKGKGFLIKGWAPQVLILSHHSIGGFLTHCGWNSTLEAICAGVPVITWPLFGDQFFNQRFVVEILRVGVMVGAESPVNWGEEENVGVLVKKEDVERAIDKLMDEGNNECEERRKRAKELAEMAKKVVEEEGGSSHINVKLLIQDILQHSTK